MKVSVQYSTMIVKSLEESVGFYRDVLGFSEGYHVDFPVGGITIMKSPEGACVELIESPQFEIGLIEYLVILYVAEQFKIIVTVESPGDFILVQVR